jgi:hypothetical protein
VEKVLEAREDGQREAGDEVDAADGQKDIGSREDVVDRVGR